MVTTISAVGLVWKNSNNAVGRIFVGWVRKQGLTRQFIKGRFRGIHLIFSSFNRDILRVLNTNAWLQLQPYLYASFQKQGERLIMTSDSLILFS